MIPNFFQTLQQDIFTVGGDLNQAYRTSSLSPLTEKTALSALRFFAAMEMGRGLLIGLSAISAVIVTPTSAVFALAWGITLYVLAHDSFIMARNRSEEIDNPSREIVNTASDVLNSVEGLRRLANWVTGNQSNFPFGEGSFGYKTRGTILRPVWMTILPPLVSFIEKVDRQLNSN